MVRKGLLAHIGAHGEPPLGLNYHAEMGFFADGGLTNYEVGGFWHGNNYSRLTINPRFSKLRPRPAQRLSGCFHPSVRLAGENSPIF